MVPYARVTVPGSPISKSNFKLSNKSGRAILPSNTGTYHDRYSEYEESIVIQARSQNPGVTLKESLIAVLKVYYKSEKRHPDTNNITKSIFDGIEKSGLIVNDAQVRRLIIEEYYDKTNPRFELELFCESEFSMVWEVKKHGMDTDPIVYSPPANKGGARGQNISSSGTQKMSSSDIPGKSARAVRSLESAGKKLSGKNLNDEVMDISKHLGTVCSVCGRKCGPGEYIMADRGRTCVCRKCLSKYI